MRKLKLLVVLVSMMLISGCSLLTPVQPADVHTYTLNSAPAYVAQHKPRASTLLVMVTGSNPLYATTQIAYRTYPHQIAYFTLNQWAQTPAEMIQPVLVQTLQRTHAFHAVVSPPYSGRYETLLNVEIIELLQDLTPCKKPRLHFTVRAILTHAATGHVIAVKEFSAVTPIYPQTPYGGVVAANRAMVHLLQKITQFTVVHRS